MLSFLSEKLAENPKEAWGLAIGVGGCLSIIPPALLFGCRYVTQGWEKNIKNEDEKSTQPPQRPKMD
ncbi:MAG: hypothetical protein AB7V32_05870 [Candidatus Berkiella sp.]